MALPYMHSAEYNELLQNLAYLDNIEKNVDQFFESVETQIDNLVSHPLQTEVILNGESTCQMISDFITPNQGGNQFMKQAQILHNLRSNNKFKAPRKVTKME